MIISQMIALKLLAGASEIVVASASITADALTEADIVAGGKTIVIELTNDTWIADITAVRQAIIDGLDSAQSELLGWNNEVRDKEVVGAVVRTSDTVVTITLTAATYDITADETITVTIPAAALTGAVEVTGSPTIGVTADVAVGAPKGRIKRKIRYVVEVDGKFIEVTSIVAAESILRQVRDIAEESAERDVVTAVAPKPPRITVKTIAGKVTTSVALQREVKRTQKVVNHAYIRRAKQIAQDIEISRLMITKIDQEERDDEESIIALLLM